MRLCLSYKVRYLQGLTETNDVFTVQLILFQNVFQALGWFINKIMVGVCVRVFI